MRLNDDWNWNQIYLDFEIVATRNEQWLLIVEANASNGAIVLIELLQQRAHPVIPELNYTAVQTENETSAISWASNENFGRKFRKMSSTLLKSMAASDGM